MEKSTFTRDYRILKDLLRRLRVEAELTQVDLAKRLGETQSFISKCERGERRLDLVQLRVFCKAIGISLQQFVASFEDAIAREKRSR